MSMLSREEIQRYARENINNLRLTSREAFLTWAETAFKNRSESLSKILDSYAEFKKQSYEKSIKYQSVFFRFMIILLAVLTGLTALGLIRSINFNDAITTISVIATLSASYFGSLFAILSTIAKYLFPESGVKQENDFINSISKDNEVLLSMINEYKYQKLSSESDSQTEDIS